MVPDPQAGVIDRRRHHVTSKHQGICPTIPEVNTETISLGFAASYARLVADHVSALDLPTDSVLAALGLAQEDLGGELAGRWVPASSLAQALDCAIALSGDPLVTLHMAQQVRPAHLGALGYTLISCTQFEGSLALFERLQSMVCTQLHAVHQFQGSHLVSHLSTVGDVPRHTGLWVFTMASRLAFARWVSGRRLEPEQVCLPCPAPPASQVAVLNRWFGCALQFDALAATERVPAAWLALPNPNADEQLHRVMGAMTDMQWARHVQDEHRLVALLRQHISARLKKGRVPLLDDISPALEDALGCSARQLQRRLAEHRLSFKNLVEQVRRDQVLHELKHTGLPLTEVASRAAYAEPSSMHRAVRRWTGMTPLAVRQEGAS